MDIDFLKECLTYNEETGYFYWKIRPLHHFKNAHAMNIWNSLYSNKKAGTVNSSNNCDHYKRVKISVNSKSIMAHQIAWSFVNGQIPNGLFIDHIDGNATNNSIVNLRLVTHSENHRNRKIQTNNKSGAQGVRFNLGKWRARIKIHGKEKHLGSFNTKEEAIEARKQYAMQNGFTERHC